MSIFQIFLVIWLALWASVYGGTVVFRKTFAEVDPTYLLIVYVILSVIFALLVIGVLANW